MRAHYIGHDSEYQKRKAAGHTGWDTAEGVQETITDLQRMLESTGFPRSGALLKLGCGAGDQTLWLSAQGYTVAGVDIAPTAIAWAHEKAQERGLKADFRVSDVRDLADFCDAAFDVVLDGRCFHCIIGEDRGRFLGAARRVLKPDGVFHVATMCGNPVGGAAGMDFDPSTRCTVYGEIATRYFGRPDDLLAEIESAGFRIIDRQVHPSQCPAHQHMLFVNAQHS